MKIKLNALILGSFIVGAVVLVAVLLLTLGYGNVFGKVGHFVIYLPGSVQGLDKGAAVSLSGLRVGEIDEMNVFYDRKTRRSLVYVLCQIDRTRLRDLHGRPIPLTDDRVLRDLVNDGLRAQVKTVGLVGGEYIGLDFYNPSQYPPQTGLPPTQHPVIPTLPSTMTQVTDAATQILASLRKIDFAAIGSQLQGVLEKVDDQVAELQTNRLTDHLSVAADSIGQLAASTNLQATVANLNDLLTNINAQVVPLSGQLEATLAQGKTTLASVNLTAEDLRDLISLRNQLGGQTRDLVVQLTQTARTFEQLANFLEQHPNAIVTGRKQPSDTP